MRYLILIIALLLSVSACKKEEGCTNPAAINYNVSAEKDDGSCVYTTGCTDATAINYNTDAVNDDGSCLYMCDDIQATNYNDTTTDPVCKYESDVVIWLDVTATQYFDSLGIPLLSVNAGNEVAGSMPTNAAFLGIVLCTDTNPEPIHYIYQWENEQMTTVTLTVYDGNLDIMFQSTEDALANGCVKLPLTRDKIEEYQDSQ